MIPTQTPVPKNFQATRHVADHQDLTPDEIAEWLTDRERQRHLQQINLTVNVALLIVGAALLYTTIKFLTH
jgi:hypothetical protein